MYFTILFNMYFPKHFLILHYKHFIYFPPTRLKHYRNHFCVSNTLHNLTGVLDALSHNYTAYTFSRRNIRAGTTCPYASLSFSAVSVQTAAVSPLPFVPGSQSYVQFSTAPAVISKPVVILFLSRYFVSVSVLHAVPV